LETLQERLRKSMTFFEVALVVHISASQELVKGHAFLRFAKPANRASVFEDDATIHAPELEQGEDSAISN
jgi:hypothetical protein